MHSYDIPFIKMKACSKYTLSSTCLAPMCLCAEIVSVRSAQIDDCAENFSASLQMDGCTENFAIHWAQMGTTIARFYSKGNPFKVLYEKNVSL